eukprot:CAMPEP_0182417826 /NCGR_PEP_ID=MMETSP1167-20130531/2267_1 /TAXON_ID=2988 /ORGANISM="Mallomonas Sp, Strain CCMP3275" /LENGTH=166 /DNA_ID=CAMNT_0024591623 /DNA_START=197 /DNA_END=697 /DNA_ORIENTATION=-
MNKAPKPVLAWTIVKEAVILGNLELLGRSAEQKLEYKEFINKIKSEHLSVTDYLLISKFGIPSERVDGKLSAIRRNSSSPPITLLAPNDFPYNFEAGILHYIFWKLGGVVEKTEIREAASSLMNSVPGAIDFVTYINPPHLKSVPEIEHAHILIKSDPLFRSNISI